MIPWRNVLRTHNAAAVFPLLKDAQPDAFDALVEDIREFGVTETIKLVRDGRVYIVVDGRNRLDALQELGWDVWKNLAEGGEPDSGYFEVMNETLPTDEDVRTYVNSLNVHRRHIPMNAGQRREWIAKVLRQTPQTSDRVIAEIAKVDPKTVRSIRAGLESAKEIPATEATVGKDGKLRKKPPGNPERVVAPKPKPKAAKQDIVPAVVHTVAEPVPSLSSDLWLAAAPEQRLEFVRAATPAAIVAAYGMPGFYRLMSEDQKDAVDAELERLWAEHEKTLARQRNLARDIGARS